MAGLPRRERPARAPLEFIEVVGASENNLKDVSVKIPLGVLCALTGPSGSGKSTLAVDIVYRALGRRLGELDLEQPGAHTRIEGAERIKTITLVDQAPLGRTSRGNAATYTKAWDLIRNLYARQPEAQARGFSAGDFSFNVEGGRCERPGGEREAHQLILRAFSAARSISSRARSSRRRDSALEAS